VNARLCGELSAEFARNDEAQAYCCAQLPTVLNSQALPHPTTSSESTALAANYSEKDSAARHHFPVDCTLPRSCSHRRHIAKSFDLFRPSSTSVHPCFTRKRRSRPDIPENPKSAPHSPACALRNRNIRTLAANKVRFAFPTAGHADAARIVSVAYLHKPFNRVQSSGRALPPGTRRAAFACFSIALPAAKVRKKQSANTPVAAPSPIALSNLLSPPRGPPRSRRASYHFSGHLTAPVPSLWKT